MEEAMIETTGLRKIFRSRKGDVVAVDGVQGDVEFADEIVEVIRGQVASAQDDVRRSSGAQRVVAVQARINLVGDGQDLERTRLAVDHRVSGGDTPKSE